MRYLEADTRLLSGGFPRVRGAGGGAVQGTAAATCGTELAAFSKHLHLALCALWGQNKYSTDQEHVLAHVQ